MIIIRIQELPRMIINAKLKVYKVIIPIRDLFCHNVSAVD